MFYTNQQIADGILNEDMRIYRYQKLPQESNQLCLKKALKRMEKKSFKLLSLRFTSISKQVNMTLQKESFQNILGLLPVTNGSVNCAGVRKK